MSVKKGGYRSGAGRPKGTGKYQEQTSPIRVPGSLLPHVQALLNQRELAYQSGVQGAIPLYSSWFAAGGSTKVDEHIGCYVDFNDYLRPDPQTMFCIRVVDDAMKGAGIGVNDVLIIDRALEAIDQKIVVVQFNKDLMIRRFLRQGHAIQLIPENIAYESMLVSDQMDFKILGVAIRVIHALP